MDDAAVFEGLRPQLFSIALLWAGCAVLAARGARGVLFARRALGGWTALDVQRSRRTMPSPRAAAT